MTRAIERLAAAFASGDALPEVTTWTTPPGRRTCFACRRRRAASMVITIDDEVFAACRPCTLDILRIDALAVRRAMPGGPTGTATG